MDNDKTERIEKIRKTIKQYEGIVRTSSNQETISRIKKDLAALNNELKVLAPEGYEFEERVGRTGSHKKSIPEKITAYSMLSAFVYSPFVVGNDDEDIEILAFIMKYWQEEFMPALGDSHVKLEFSLSAERDHHYMEVENLNRLLNVMKQSVEDYAKAIREDVKMQMRETKRKHARYLTFEAAKFLKKQKEFWERIRDGIAMSGQSCMNPLDKIVFNKKFEKATFFENYLVREVIDRAILFINESIELLNLPELPEQNSP